MAFDPDRALDVINRHKAQNARQLESINRLLDEWRQLQDWASDRLQMGEENVSAEQHDVYQAVLDQMAEIRLKDAKGDENGG